MMIPPAVRDFFKKKLRKLSIRKRVDHGLHNLVLAEADEAAKFRRRMHLHLCLIGVAGGMTLLSVSSIVDVASVAYLTLGLNCTQEIIDYAGRF
jgi:hypothetical protein